MAKIERIENAKPGDFDLMYFCPGCQSAHGVRTIPHAGPESVWTFNNDFEKPTIRNSILVNGHYSRDKPGGGLEHVNIICHSFITAGKIQFLDDCTHKLAGQTVDMEDV